MANIREPLDFIIKKAFSNGTWLRMASFKLWSINDTEDNVFWLPLKTQFGKLYELRLHSDDPDILYDFYLNVTPDTNKHVDTTIVLQDVAANLYYTRKNIETFLYGTTYAKSPISGLYLIVSNVRNNLSQYIDGIIIYEDLDLKN